MSNVWYCYQRFRVHYLCLQWNLPLSGDDHWAGECAGHHQVCGVHPSPSGCEDQSCSRSDLALDSSLRYSETGIFYETYIQREATKCHLTPTPTPSPPKKNNRANTPPLPPTKMKYPMISLFQSLKKEILLVTNPLVPTSQSSHPYTTVSENFILDKSCVWSLHTLLFSVTAFGSEPCATVCTLLGLSLSLFLIHMSDIWI